MTFNELARKRYSCRKLSAQPVEQEKIDAILEAARVAPTAKNLQPFHIYVLKSAEAISKINKLSRCAYEAPVVFIVCYDKSKAWVSPFDTSDNSGVMDASIVGTHMMLEAFDQGLGSCWVKFFDPREVSAAFDIPANLTPSFLLDVGYPQKGTDPTKMHFEKRDIKNLATYK
ncbi:MAG: nitroreductase family protein [Kiritimatiellae bacterium]|nr:nitroreductase family protein [Kiritimatiellia bacterium]